LRRHLVRLLAVMMTSACASGDPAGPQVDSVSGTYRLEAYDGRMLPAQAATTSSASRQVLFGSLVLHADGTCSKSETVLKTEANGSTTEAYVTPCTYQVARVDGLLDLRLDHESVQIASFSGSTVVYSDFFATREYRRVRP